MSAGDVEQMLGAAADLTAPEATVRRQWVPGAVRFLRPGVPAITFGPRGSGKSFVAIIAGEQIVEAGGSIAYLDFENGRPRMAERMSAILADRDDEARQAVSERFAYFGHPRLNHLGDSHLADEWGEALGSFDLIIIDSIARALGQLGLDESSTPDFARFMVSYVDPLSARDTAVLLLDNVGHAEAHRPRGASGKLDLVELAYRVTSDPIAPRLHGSVHLHRTRTRDGDEAGHLTVGVGGGTYTRLEVVDALHDVALLDAAVKVLTDGQHTSENPLGVTSLLKVVREQGISGNDKQLRAQLIEAASDPEAPFGRHPARGLYLAPEAPSAGSANSAPSPDLGRAAPSRTEAASGSPKNGPTKPNSASVDSTPRGAKVGSAGRGGSITPPDPPPAPADEPLAAAVGADGADSDALPEGWTLAELEELAAVEVNT